MMPKIPQPSFVLLRVVNDDQSMYEFTVENPHKVRLDVSGHPPAALLGPITTDAYIPVDFAPHVEISLDAASLNQTQQIHVSRVSAARAMLLAEGEAAIRADERKRCADQLRREGGRLRAGLVFEGAATVFRMASLIDPPSAVGVGLPSRAPYWPGDNRYSSR